MTTVCYLTDWECIKTQLIIGGIFLAILIAGFPIFLFFTREKK